MIKELEANPDLAKNENVFRELGGDLPSNQKMHLKLVVISDQKNQLSLRQGILVI